jgi:hypothetical protein
MWSALFDGAAPAGRTVGNGHDRAPRMRACDFAVAEVELTPSLPMQTAPYGFRESLLLPLPAPALGIPNTVGKQPIQIGKIRVVVDEEP